MKSFSSQEARAKQGDFYAQMASAYDAMHVWEVDHDFSLAVIAGVARKIGVASILDVGAGTGRALEILRGLLPDVRIVGIEPDDALREIGTKKGFGPDMLMAGKGEELPFAEGSFDLVIETAVLHHVPNPSAVVDEMLRVARLGIAISDANNLGQGSWPARFAKNLLRQAGLWRAFTWIQTGGKMWKWSEGDGLYYSYSVFDNLDQVRQRFPYVYLFNTRNSEGPNLRRDCAHVCLIGLADVC